MTPSQETFLVTGATGCIGAWVLRTLVEEGAAVVGLSRTANTERLRLVMETDDLRTAMLVKADVTDREAIERAVDEHAVTRIIHLAALQIPFCREDPIAGALTNVVGTTNVFEVARARSDQVRGVVYASSIAMYGPDDQDEILRSEEAIARPKTHYGAYKQANEHAARIFWQDNGVSSVCLRPWVAYGPGRDQGLTSAPTKAMLAAASGETAHVPYGGTFIYNYAPDLARTFVNASVASLEGARFFNAPGSVLTMDEVVETIQDVAGIKVTFDDTRLPFPADARKDGLEQAGCAAPVTPFRDAVQATIEHFRRTGARPALA
jgi:nucleoside-diphosphate-sugar epimerase